MITYEEVLNKAPRQISKRIDLNVTPDQCWNWLGAIDGKGYPKVTIFHRRYIAHRMLYEVMTSDLSKGEAHHKCHNKTCVNPNHIEKISSENHHKIHRRTHCKNGHPMTEDNIIYDHGRTCRKCRNKRALKYRLNRKTKQKPSSIANISDDFNHMQA